MSEKLGELAIPSIFDHHSTKLRAMLESGTLRIDVQEIDGRAALAYLNPEQARELFNYLGKYLHGVR